MMHVLPVGHHTTQKKPGTQQSAGSLSQGKNQVPEFNGRDRANTNEEDRERFQKKKLSLNEHVKNNSHEGLWSHKNEKKNLRRRIRKIILYLSCLSDLLLFIHSFIHLFTY